MAELEYEINKTTLENSIEFEVSKVAARTANNNGDSMYDLLKIYKSDEALVGNFISDAEKSVLSAFSDIAKYAETTGQNDKILFNIPDFDSGNELQVTDAIDRYIVSQAASSWFESRLPDVAKIYTAQAVAEIKMLSVLLRQRKTITRT